MGQEGISRTRVLAARVVASTLAFLVVLAVTFAYAGASDGAAIEPSGAELCATVRAWRSKYGNGSDLQIVVTNVTFRGKPSNFVAGEGIVVAPVALNLDGVQDVIDVHGTPPAQRTFRDDGIAALGWSYPGTLHRDLTYSAVSLVRRSTSEAVKPPAEPHFDTLPELARMDSRLTAKDLEVHGLERCKSFPEWARRIGGAPPYTEQVLRLAREAASHAHDATKSDRRIDDPCSSLRKNDFDWHTAQVAAVMGSRQLGVPAYGFVSADHRYLIATFVDGLGWISVDLQHVDRGYERGGTALLTKAPIVGRFEASDDGFWSPAGEAFADRNGMMFPLSHTEWSGGPNADEDTTTTFALPLAGACQ